jgi:hypothetical protein
MPSSRFLISSQTLGSSAASVTFSSIPATYTDLVLRYSVRLATGASIVNSEQFRLNSDTTSNYSETEVGGSGSGAGSSRKSNVTAWELGYFNGNGSTSNTFSSHEIYIPNYTGTANKAISYFGATEQNSSTDNQLQAIAKLYRGSSAISSIFIGNYGVNFVSGSSFYLYGLRSS